MTAKPHSLDVLRPDTPAVDFLQGPSANAAILPILEITDSLETLASKMQALANIVRSEESLAVATGLKATTNDATRARVMGNKEELFVIELAEIDTCTRIIGIAADVKRLATTGERALTREIRASTQMILGRERELRGIVAQGVASLGEEWSP
ncbi:MAG: hypothetical protein Q9220_006222 [cf. Caloplaca sp. 1 TL-2023]